MSSNYEPLVPASVTMRTDGIPVSPFFDDVYYSGIAPLAQAREVFLGGNGLPGRWRDCGQFTVLETGFGLGHNFLALWDAWRSDPHRCARLHFVSVEAHPFTRSDLSRMLESLDGSPRELARALVRAWPVLTPGIHRLEFEHGAVTLTLAFGSVTRIARQLELGFDACFLDGFSPRVNPDMWTPLVFRQLARMAKKDATLATWCSAGHVRRGLQDAGFLIQRHAGFGTKRHRISGRLRPGMGRAPLTPVPGSVAVVGGGFAGAAAAYALAARGQQVTVFDPAFRAGISGTHRGHRGAAMTPALSRDDDIRTRLSRAGVLQAMLRWHGLPEPARPFRCGAFEPVSGQDMHGWQRALDHLQLPQDYARWVSASQASELTGIGHASGGLWHEYGHLVRPEPLLEGLLSSPAITTRDALIGQLARNDKGTWLLYNGSGKHVACAEWVVVANSWLAHRLLVSIPGIDAVSRLKTLHRVAGQLSYFPVCNASMPASLLAGDGLCMPDGKTGLIGGSTYVTDTTLSIITEEGHHENREKVVNLLEDQSLQLGWPRRMADGWAGWRAAVRDRLPVIGSLSMAPGLWLACGFGSRGLTWSALNAELLAAKLNHEPAPLERELLKKIAPL